GIERIGVASGLKYFGAINWFREGSQRLVKSQKPDGSWEGGAWNKLPETCWAMLFLVRGRAPVAISKLDYSSGGEGASARAANWNERRRDAANFARWLGKQTERFFNWQIVNLRAPVEELHDSPLLYISGDQAIPFSKEEQAKLKKYLDQGGLL